jgi:drug/metabolite transporter (DMT)-like permease
MALDKADASLVGPLLTFNPAFTLLIAWLTLGEMPGVRQTAGAAVVLLGAICWRLKKLARDYWLRCMC